MAENQNPPAMRMRLPVGEDVPVMALEDVPVFLARVVAVQRNSLEAAQGLVAFAAAGCDYAKPACGHRAEFGRFEQALEHHGGGVPLALRIQAQAALKIDQVECIGLGVARRIVQGELRFGEAFQMQKGSGQSDIDVGVIHAPGFRFTQKPVTELGETVALELIGKAKQFERGAVFRKARIKLPPQVQRCVQIALNQGLVSLVERCEGWL